MNAQEELAQLLIATSLRLERVIVHLTAEGQRELKALMVQVSRDLTLSGVFDTTKPEVILRRLDIFSKDCKQSVRVTYKQIWKDFQQALKDISQRQSTSVVEGINKVAGADLANHPTDKEIAASVAALLLMGASVQVWFERQAQATYQKITDTIKIAVLRGDSMEQVQSMLSGKPIQPKPAEDGSPVPPILLVVLVSQPQSQLESLIRTAAGAVAAAAVGAVMDANADIIMGMQWVSVMDWRTTPVCRSLNGLTWTLDFEPIGKHNIPFQGFPPIHWNCRSHVIPMLKPWSDMK